MRQEYASLAQLIPKVWDAITDPIMGYLSDRTNSRWGRRRPWYASMPHHLLSMASDPVSRGRLFGAAIPSAVFFVLLWWFPSNSSPEQLFVYFLLIYCLQRTAYTGYMVPYAALTMEMSAKDSDRTTLTSYRFFFGAVGNLVCVALFGAIPNRVLPANPGPEDYRRGFVGAGLFVGAIVAVAILLCSVLARERPLASRARDRLPGWSGLIYLFRNRSFVVLTAMTALLLLSIQLVQSNMIQFFVYYMGLTKPTASNAILITLAVLIPVVPLVRLGLTRIDKRWMWLFGSVIFAAFCLAVWRAPKGAPQTDAQSAYAFYLAAHFGLVLSVLFYLPWTMIPDCIDQDELNTGVRREGTYYAVFIFFEKIASGIGLSIAGFVLSAKGYDPENPQQNFSLGDTYRDTLAIGGFAVMAFATALIVFYPITRASRYQMQAELLERRAAANNEGKSLKEGDDEGEQHEA